VIKLLIVIPTYNRSSYLDEQLNRLSKIVVLSRENKIETNVLVRDNGSDYDVESVVTNYGFEYKSNSVNLGGDFNFILSFLDSVNYDYLWILSDDDWVIINRFELIICKIKSHESDLIVLNDTNYSGLSNFSGSNIKDFFALGSGLISRTIYNVKSFKPFYGELMKYWYTGFPHLAIQLIFLTRVRNHYVTTIEEKLFDEINHRTMPDSLGYRKSLYGFVGLLSIIDRKQRRPLFGNWWRDHYNKFKAFEYKKDMKSEFEYWYITMKKNIHFFRIRSAFYLVFIYPIVKLLVAKQGNELSIFLRNRYVSSKINK
jgi:glycosyltransferase involved in cell wall biosynthesis